MKLKGENTVNKRLIIIMLLITFIWMNISSIVIAAPLRVDAGSSIAIDVKTGAVLFDQNSHRVVAMASTTKIVTCLVALKYGNLDEEVEISKTAVSIRGSKVGYKAGEKIKLRELLYGLMLKSGNDCAIAIAEGISGSIEEFCNLMNEYALSIGLLDSHFESPHGLDSSRHYSSAYDLAIATMKAKEIEEFNKIVKSKVVDGNENKFTRSFNNINKLLYQEPNCTGVKTGYTGQAGKCLVSSFDMKPGEIIVVTLNCTERWKESKRIYDYVKENYTYENIIKKGQVFGKATLEDKKEIELVAKEDIIYPCKNSDKINIDIVLPKYTLERPVRMDEPLGMILISDKSGVNYRVPLYSKEEYKVKTIKDIIFDFFK